MAKASPEEVYWRGRVASAQHDELETVRKGAAAWTTLFTAVIGVFGTVAFASGLPALDDLDEKLQDPVKWATIAAGVLALVATVMAGIAAGPSLKKSSDSSWQGMRTRTRDSARTALTLLNIAKILGGVAAAIVFVGSVVIFLSGEAPGSAPKLVAVVNGTAVCGPLGTASDGAAKVGSTPLAGASYIVVVTRCP
jgi:hypothetical protein